MKYRLLYIRFPPLTIPYFSCKIFFLVCNMLFVYSTQKLKFTVSFFYYTFDDVLLSCIILKSNFLFMKLSHCKWQERSHLFLDFILPYNITMFKFLFLSPSRVCNFTAGNISNFNIRCAKCY